MSDERSAVLITGSSSGIGRLTALTVARAGYRVYASMRGFKGKNQGTAKELSDLARREGLDLEVLELDVVEPSSIQYAIQDLIAKDRRIDVLVNNAGKMPIGISEGYTDEQLHQHFALNFYGPVRLCRALLPQMRERKSGLIIHVSSILGRLLLPGCGIYCASKFALEAYAEVLHYELTGLGIDSVLVEPGPYPTNLLPNRPKPEDRGRVLEYGELASGLDVFVDQFEKYYASGAAHDPQEIADAILHLIGLPSGKRPLRTVCGEGYGTSVINRQNAPVQAQALREFGFEASVDRVA